jgi:hypothetical protein
MADSEKTATHSAEPSVLDYEKRGAAEMVLPATAGSQQVTAPAEEHIIADEKTSKRDSQASASDEEDDDFEYPTKWRLTAITIALCLSVFCMALVCYHRSKPDFERKLTSMCRITQLLQQLFLASRINSKRSTTSDGMDLPTY